MAEAPVKTTPDTIVLVHGFWVTPRSWEHWNTHYESQGYRVLAPAYPGFEVEVEALNATPRRSSRFTVPKIIGRSRASSASSDKPPILMGTRPAAYSCRSPRSRLRGGRGGDQLGTDGRRQVTPLSQLKSTFPVLKNPANRHEAVGFTFEQWSYTFTNTFPETESQAHYERYHVPAQGASSGAACSRTSSPGTGGTGSTTTTTNRAPLLFVSGEQDHLMPPAVQRSNAKHYKSNTITEIREFPGRSHLMPASRGGRRSLTPRSRVGAKARRGR